MKRKFGIIRDGKSIVIYTNWLAILAGCLLSALLLVIGVAGLVHGTPKTMDILSLVFGAFFFIIALWIGFSRMPLLIVSTHGVSSPLLRQAEPIEWGRIADIRLGSAYTANTLDVRVWRDVNHPEAGTTLALRVAFLGLPMQTKTLIAEILTYRPADHRNSP